MIRSTNRELGEFDLIRKPEHVAKVWAEIESRLPKYWESTLGSMAPFHFIGAIDDYNSEAEKYRELFSAEAMDEFHDDPNSFKQTLMHDVPVTARTLRQKRAELKEWQMHFRRSSPNDLLTVFANVMDFQETWREAHPPAEYAGYDALEEFELDPLDDDETMRILKVVGMGIKSIILHHLDAGRFPARSRYGLYGLFFLTGHNTFGLPSDSSEFVMINDEDPTSSGSLIMDQNYWYPYGLFSLYALRISRWLEPHINAGGVKFDANLRFVFVERFFKLICDEHNDDLKTMRDYERFDV
ncbi:MAG: hypothetical protein KDB68_16210 [Planctomycetes bacterium]|nr:hypothetical protein [Planctomycetota bacterium]